MNQDDKVECIEVSREWNNVPRSTGDLGKFEYNNLTATDGTDISSRSKHRKYMKENNLSLTTDFKDTWAQGQTKREALRRGEISKDASQQLKADLGRAWHQIQESKRGR